MNKKRLKVLKQLAGVLPKVQVVRGHSYAFKGSELDEKHLNDIKETGVIFDENETYEFKNNFAYDMNHFRSLKKAYKRNGDKGVIEYLKRVRVQRAAILKLYGKDQKVEFVNSWLDKLINAGPTKIWKVLNVFLTAFFAVFGSHKKEDQ